MKKLKNIITTLFAALSVFSSVSVLGSEAQTITIKCPILNLSDFHKIQPYGEQSRINDKYGSWLMYGVKYSKQREQTGSYEDLINFKALAKKAYSYEFTGGNLHDAVKLPICLGELKEKDGAYLKVGARFLPNLDSSFGCTKQIDKAHFSCLLIPRQTDL